MLRERHTTVLSNAFKGRFLNFWLIELWETHYYCFKLCRLPNYYGFSIAKEDGRTVLENYQATSQIVYNYDFTSSSVYDS